MSAKVICVALLVAYVNDAVKEDEAGNYEKAIQLYTYALEYFKTHLKYEKNERAKVAITAKVCGLVGSVWVGSSLVACWTLKQWDVWLAV